jgi:hypothetical protein
LTIGLILLIPVVPGRTPAGGWWSR